MRIKTDIIFTKYDRAGNKLETQIQPCRSFVKQLWELLYISCAQIDPATPRATVIDMAGQSRSIDKLKANSGLTDAVSAKLESTLTCVAPGGLTAQYLATMANMHSNNNASSVASTWKMNSVPGQILGIQVGTGNTAVAPNDFHLIARCGHGVSPANAVESLMQGYNPGTDNTDAEVYGANVYGMVFSVYRHTICTKIQTKLYREGVPGDVTMRLVGTTPSVGGGGGLTMPQPEIAAGLPISTVTQNLDAITNVSPGVMVDWVLPSAVELVPGMRYAIVLSEVGGTAANNVHWRYLSTVQNSPEGGKITSTDTGVTWSAGSIQPLVFAIYGTTRTELEYGGCDMRNLSVANPNASFVISRLFYNNSGEAVNLQECGLAAAGKRTVNGADNQWNSQVFPFLIARDVIAPAINLLDGEVLQVSYTPAVTV